MVLGIFFLLIFKIYIIKMKHVLRSKMIRKIFKSIILKFEALRDSYVKDLLLQNAKLKTIKLVNFNGDECWLWQGDFYDNPNSLTCPVVMSAEMLRELLNDKDPERLKKLERINEINYENQKSLTHYYSKPGNCRKHKNHYCDGCPLSHTRNLESDDECMAGFYKEFSK